MNRDLIADVYYGNAGSASFQKRTRRRVHWMASRARGQDVLDVGCSQGVVAVLLAREGYRVVGVDVETEAIAEAVRYRDLEEPAVRERLTFLKEDGRSLPFSDGAFDTVLHGEILEHVLSPEPLLDEAMRVLRPGGALIITTPYGRLDHPDHKEPVYLAPLLDLLVKRGVVEQLRLVDRYLSVVVQKSEEPAPKASADLWIEALRLADRRIASIETSLSQAEDRAAQQAASASELSERVAELERQLEDEDEANRLRAATELLEARESELRDLRERELTGREQLLDLQREAFDRESSLRTELSDVRAEHAAARAQGELLERELVQTREQLDSARAERQELARRLESAQREASAKEFEVTALQGERDALGAKLEVLESQLAATRERESELATALAAHRERTPTGDRSGGRETGGSVAVGNGDAPSDVDRLERQIEHLEAELATALSGSDQAQAELRDARAQAERTLARGERLEREWTSERTRSSELESQVTQLRAELASTLESLEEISTDREGLLDQLARREPEDAASAVEVDEAGRPTFVPHVPWPNVPPTRPGMKVAAILDPFSQAAYRYEFQLIEFGQDDWRETLEREQPDLLWVESAWRGNGGRWKYTMNKPERGPAQSLVDLVSWCRLNGIPSVFWNKEDPNNFDLFVKTAVIFDHVFTVDSDCLPRYEHAGAQSVHVLPFAAQPRIHNPVRIPNQRSRGIGFAGSWYGDKHPARREQMKVVLEPAVAEGVEIFSRFEADPKHRFPEPLAGAVVGSVDYEDMPAVTKLYQLMLNVNSVVASPTMCARRIFECLASGTPVISGQAKSIDPLLGEGIVLQTDDPDRTKRLIQMLRRSPELRDRTGHLGLRRVLEGHTYGDRVNDVLRVLGLEASTHQPSVSMIFPTKRQPMLDNLLANAARQTYAPLQVVIVLHGLRVRPDEIEARARQLGLDDVVVVEADAHLTLGEVMNLGCDAADGDVLSKADDDNWYAANYIGDLIATYKFANAPIVGKWAHYVWLGGRNILVLRFPTSEHAYTRLVQGGTLTFTRDLFQDVRFRDVPRAVDTTFLTAARAHGARPYSADRWNYVSIRQAEGSDHTWKVEDDELLRTGVAQVFGQAFDHVEL